MTSVTSQSHAIRPGRSRVCPDCESALYGATSVGGRAARVTWICRKPGCGFVLGDVPVHAPRCLCRAVVPPGTGSTFLGAESIVTICAACSEMHPGGAPPEILAQHRRAERALATEAEYDFARGRVGHEPTVSVTKRETGATYTVNLCREPFTCSCPDYVDRCAGSTLRCKHVLMVLHWLADQPAAREPEPVAAVTRAADPLPVNISQWAEEQFALIERQRLLAQRGLDERVADLRADVERQLRERLEQAARDRDLLWPTD